MVLMLVMESFAGGGIFEREKKGPAGFVMT